MLRINLLPIRQLKKRAKARNQIIGFVMIFCALLLALGFIGFVQTGRIKNVQASIAELKREEQRLAPEIREVDRLEAQKKEHDKLEQDVALEVWTDYQGYQTAKARLPLADKLVNSASKSNEVALGRYKEGVGTILDVLNAQDQLSQALLQQVNARYDLQTQRANLVKSMGLLYQSVPHTSP